MMRAASSPRRPLGLRCNLGAALSSLEPAGAPEIHARRPRRPGRTALWVPLWLLTLASCGGPVALRPNLLLVTVDTLRPDRLACYGGPEGTGEEICAIGESGARYSWAISPSPFTSVAIASILTSRYPSEHGMTAFASSSLRSSVVTLADALRAGGYKTAAFVANPTLNRSRNLHQGFDLYEDRLPALASLPAEATGTSHRSASSLTDAALAFAEVSDAPWFIWVHFVETRGPYAPEDLEPDDEIAATSLPRDWRSTRLRRLDDQSGRGGVPAYQLDATEAQATPSNGRDVKRSPSGPQTVSGDDLLRRYDREIRRVDAQIGRLAKGLDTLGRPGVLITADHGEALGEDGYWFAHGHSLGLDQLRVPLVWRPPHRLDAESAAPSGLVVSDPISTLDVAPTLLAAAGLVAPTEFEGVALVEVAADTARRQSRNIFAEHPVRGAIVSRGVYFARDRWPLDQPIPDPLRGGELKALPPRIARLADDPRAPRYRTLALDAPNSVTGADGSADELATLEPALAEFLATAATQPGYQPAATDPSLVESELE